MKTKSKEEILKVIEILDEISDRDASKMINTLNKLLDNILILFSSVLSKPLSVNRPKIVFGSVKKDNGARYGLISTKEKITIAKWILNLQHNTKRYFLILFLVKEGFRHFLSESLSEEEEAILNIISIVFLTEILGISTIDNPMLSAIRAKIYTEELANLDTYYWDNLLIVLIIAGVPFETVFNQLSSIVRKSVTPLEKVQQFSKWVAETTKKEEASIVPIYTNSKLIELIDMLMEYGYEKSTTSYIAKKKKLSQKTISKWFRALNQNYATYWLSSINYEEMNLHTYFLKITTTSEIFKQKINDFLLKIPYLQTLYNGYNSESIIIYSPNLICPHIISEQLNTKLGKMKNSGILKDFSVQLVREKFRYLSITNFPYTPTAKTFRKLITQGDEYLKKYLFWHEKRSSDISSTKKQIVLDYNLLYFLSIIQGKYPLRARYAVRINEFQNFCQKNSIPSTDIKAQTDLLYQQELRAKKKGLLSFSLYMSNFVRHGSDVCVFEIPLSNILSKVDFQSFIDRLRVFSHFSQINLYDRYIFLIPRISHNHFVAKIVKEEIDKEGLPSTFYTIKTYKFNYIPYQELYDFDLQRWKISDL